MKKTTVFLSALLLLMSVAFANTAKNEKGPEPLRISHGEKVALADYLVPGKITIFDFTSNYCPPCRMIAPHLDKLHETRDDIAVVAVDINRPETKGIDWKSPVARQYDLHSIPHFKVYGADGKMMAEGDEARSIVFGWLQE